MRDICCRPAISMRSSRCLRSCEIGVSALKIEGRYKDADYVALTTHAYRKALDEAWAEAAPQHRSRRTAPTGTGLLARLRPALPDRNQPPKRSCAGARRGIAACCIGRVTRVAADAVTWRARGGARNSRRSSRGTGWCSTPPTGAARRNPKKAVALYARDARARRRASNCDSATAPSTSAAYGRATWCGAPTIPISTAPCGLSRSRRLRSQSSPFDVRVTAAEGAPLIAEWTLAKAPEIRVTVASDAAARSRAEARHRPGILREQFGRLGNTPFELADVELETRGRPFAPASLLNQLRQRAVRAAAGAAAAADGCGDYTIRGKSWPMRSPHCGPPKRAMPRTPQLHLLVRTPEQLDAALEAAARQHHARLPGPLWPAPSVERVKAAGIAARVAAPRVLKPGEERILDFLLRLECGILVRSAGLLDALRASASTRR